MHRYGGVGPFPRANPSEAVRRALSGSQARSKGYRQGFALTVVAKYVGDGLAGHPESLGYLDLR